MLVVENLVKNYGELTAVDDVSFEASAGTAHHRQRP
jgi:ABC-type branched-subunit amino acid transport system ATPase component